MTRTGSFTTLAEWLPWLETLSPREIVLGLERVELVLQRLELRRPDIVIHVGGTNGKGSSAAMLEVLLLADGRQTGCYTSPHIRRYNERIRVNGQPASDAAILQAFQLLEVARGDVPLTFFEFGTLAALIAFDQAGVTAWILEVGLGGRLDAVNAIDPDISLITNVALDHCAWLGDDIESIATEKAGIMRHSAVAVFGSPDVPQAIRTIAADLGAELRVAGIDFKYGHGTASKGLWTWQGRHCELLDLAPLLLPGEVQLQNAAAVLAVLEGLGLQRLLTTQVINNAFAELDIEGRFQVVERNCAWILDVAHNPAAAQALADRLQHLHTTGPVTAIIGMLQDKDIAGVLKPLRDHVDRWIAVTVNGSRAASATTLAQQVAETCKKPCLVAGTINAAMDIANATSKHAGAVLVTGSFYLVGPALEWLQRR